jgi:hypothetical protein
MSDPADALYTDIATVPGSVLVISFAHRGRCGGIDVMKFEAGPTGGLQTEKLYQTDVSSKWTLYSGACPLSHATALRAGCSACVRLRGRLRVGFSATHRWAHGALGP